MMQVINNPERKNWKKVLCRPTAETMQQREMVQQILADVKLEGDAAVRKYSALYDCNVNDSFQITEKEISKSAELLPAELKNAIENAAKNIRAFHAIDVFESKVTETTTGITCWKKKVPVDRVGLYIPGGTAPLFSTVLMLGIPASIAGCNRIVLCTPAKNGEIHSAVLFAASVAGIKEIYGVGGAQAIAAMAYGTESIPAVDKIFGPGNSYVTLAKQLVQLEGVAIDMPAGPSEICVLATEGADPMFIAADLLAQAEHGPDSQVILIASSEKLVEEVLKEVREQLNRLERKEVAAQALQNSRAIIFSNIDDAVEMVNEYAPEHLLLIGEAAEQKAGLIRNAGSVFIGAYSPEAAGDYATGTNHTLPTNGYARAYSGVSTESFMKTITYQQLTKDGLQSISETVITMAEAEGLQGHANSVKVRQRQTR